MRAKAKTASLKMNLMISLLKTTSDWKPNLGLGVYIRRPKKQKRGRR